MIVFMLLHTMQCGESSSLILYRCAAKQSWPVSRRNEATAIDRGLFGIVFGFSKVFHILVSH